MFYQLLLFNMIFLSQIGNFRPILIPKSCDWWEAQSRDFWIKNTAGIWWSRNSGLEMTGNRFLHSHSSHSHAVNSHSSHSQIVSFPFPWDFHRVIPIPIPFPKMYSKTIKCKCKQSTVEQQKTVLQKVGHQSWKNKNSKNTIHNTFKIRHNYLYSHPSECYVSVMAEQRNAA